jgi:membrane-bound lytic murein transglycosylase A
MPILLLILLFLGGCSQKQFSSNQKFPSTTTHFQPISFSELAGWESDHHEEALKTFHKSCNKILQKKSTNGKKVGDNLMPWKRLCKRALEIPITGKGTDLRKARLLSKEFFERNFQAYSVASSNHGRNYRDQGLITGYYEIELQGSLKKTPHCPHPIHLPPKNLKQLHGSHKIKRSSIHKGSLTGQDLELVWVKDLPRFYFMQMQGTGVVRLQEGGEMGLVWAGKNGFKFEGLPNKYKGSSLEIMHQLRIEPDSGKKTMECNESYIFFKPRKEVHPVGSSNVMLSPERSVALDSSIYSYGVPFWLDIALPRIPGLTKGGEKYRKLVIGQDRGGAIKGGNRLDLFLGRGRRAEIFAGGLRAEGKVIALFPKEIKIPTTFNRK